MKEGKNSNAREEQEITPSKLLSPISQLSVTEGLYCIIIFTLGFQTRCNPSTLADGVKNTWLKIPRFSSKLEIKKNGEAVWKPVNVRVEDHFIIPNFDNTNIGNPNQFFEDYTSNIANTPMDISKPLWEFHLLNIKTSNAESFDIGKLHHSLGDGMSLMSLLLASSRKISNLEALPTPTVTRKHVDPNNKGWQFIGRFWLLIRILFTTIIELFKALLTLCFMRDTKTPLMGTSINMVRPRKVIHRIISFDDVKLVKNAMEMVDM